jgi:hypothetical protein
VRGVSPPCASLADCATLALPDAAAQPSTDPQCGRERRRAQHALDSGGVRGAREAVTTARGVAAVAAVAAALVTCRRAMCALL